MNSEIVSFCCLKGICMLRDEYQVEFESRTSPSVKGFLIGYRDNKFAVTLGPEIPEIFLVDVSFMIKNCINFPKRCKL
jgi:hypothetical protein